jgi:hypothetical protein
MRESLRGFERRTGLAYRCTPEQLVVGRALRDACPTLFRYPGACGLREVFTDSLNELGRPGGSLLWLADRPLHAAVAGARHFGTLAVLEPLRARPVLTRRRGVYVGLNQPPGQLGPLVWVPPSALHRAIDWDRVRTPADARRCFGPGLAAEKARVVERLHAYLEEVSCMQRAGAPPPPRPWCEVSPRARAARLAAAAVSGTWTRRHDGTLRV